MQTQLHQYSISIQINKKVELIAKTPERVVVPGVGHVLSFVWRQSRSVVWSQLQLLLICVLDAY